MRTKSTIFVACELELEIIPLNANIRKAKYVIHRYGTIDKRTYRADKNRPSPNLQMLWRSSGAASDRCFTVRRIYAVRIYEHTFSLVNYNLFFFCSELPDT